MIDSRAAAGGIVAAEALAKATADGYSLLEGADSPITILPQLLPGLPYNARADLVPVASLGKIDFVLVTNPRTGFKTLRDFFNTAKLKPGQYNYASDGNGSRRSSAWSCSTTEPGSMSPTPHTAAAR